MVLLQVACTEATAPPVVSSKPACESGADRRRTRLEGEAEPATRSRVVRRACIRTAARRLERCVDDALHPSEGPHRVLLDLVQPTREAPHERDRHREHGE